MRAQVPTFLGMHKLANDSNQKIPMHKNIGSKIIKKKKCISRYIKQRNYRSSDPVTHTVL